MPRTRLRSEAANYIRDSGSLAPDVWAGFLDIEEATQPIGERRADFFIVDVMNHFIFYKWYSAEHKEVLIVKPK